MYIGFGSIGIITHPRRPIQISLLVFRLKCHRGSFIRVQLTISQHLFKKWLGAKQTTSHYLNQWWPSISEHHEAKKVQFNVTTNYRFQKTKRLLSIRPRHNNWRIVSENILPMSSGSHRIFFTVTCPNTTPIYVYIHVKSRWLSAACLTHSQSAPVLCFYCFGVACVCSVIYSYGLYLVEATQAHIRAIHQAVGTK